MLLSVQKIKQKIQKQTILNGVDFQAQTGEIIGIIGVNGAGKTTLLKILAGMTNPLSGKVEIDGKKLKTKATYLRKKISFLSENAPLYEEMKVREYLTFFAKLKRVPFRQRARQVKEVLELCRLDGLKKTIISKLSRGQKQSVALANALLNNPNILILDEPTNELDAHHSQMIREIIGQGKKKTLTIITSHFLEEIEILCDRVILLHKGKIKIQGKTEEIFSNIHQGKIIYLQVDRENASNWLEKIPSIKRVNLKKTEGIWNRYQIITTSTELVVEKINELSKKEGWNLRELSIYEPSFEELFKEAIFTYQ